jgi:hypothetical protein
VLDITDLIGAVDQQFKYNYIGSIGRVNKKYVTHIREGKQSNFKDYIYDESIVKY